MEGEAIRPGDDLNGLEVIRELGRGPHGAIYLARDPLIGRHVTLKTIPGAGTGEPLLGLLRRVGGLSHPHVSHLHRIHPHPGGDGWILEMEYLVGSLLSERLAIGDPLPAAEVVGIARAVLSGLAAAHRRGITHGQLDAQKVILGKGGLVKLVDFGVAAALAAEPPEHEDLLAAALLLRRMLERIGGTERESELVRELDRFAGRWIEAPDAAGSSRALAELERIVQRHGGEPAAPGSLGPRGSALVGRAREIERIETALVEAMRGRAAGLVVEGGPGSGRSSLLEEARRMASAAGVAHLDLESEGVAGSLFRAAGRAGLEIAPGADGAANASDCAPLVRALLRQPERIHESARYTTYRACEGLIAELCARGPLLITLDGLDRVPPDESRLLAELLRKGAARRLLVIATADGDARGTAPTAFAAAPNVDRMELPPLEAGAIHRLLEERAGGLTPASELVQHVLEVCEGNPLLTLELFDHLRGAGFLEQDRGVLRPKRSWEEIPPPPRCAELFGDAFHRLDDDQRTILRAASVDGLEFEGEAVAVALGLPSIAVLRTLQTIWRKGGLLRTCADGHRFEHGLLREWIYRSVPPAERAGLHRAIAEHLEGRTESARVAPARLARHWEAAGEPDRARPHFLRAAEAVDPRRNPHRAVDLARRAGWEPGRIPAAEILRHAGLALDLARAHLAGGEPERAERLLRDVERAAGTGGDDSLRRRVRVEQARLRCETEGPGSIDEGELIEVRSAEPEGALRAAACHLLGRAAKQAGRFDEAERWLDEASRMQEDAGERSSLALSLDQLASVAARDGRLRDACRLYRRGAELCRDAGLDAEAALNELNEKRCASEAGGAGDLVAAFEECLRQLSIAGQRRRHAQVTVALAEHLLEQGERETALALVERSLPLLTAAGHLAGLLPAERLLGRLALRDGDLDRAGDHLARAVQLASRAGDVAAGAEAEALEAQRLCLLGGPGEALDAAETALRRSREASDRRARGRVVDLLTEALFLGLPTAPFLEAEAWEAGAGERTTLLRGALAWATVGGSIHDLREAAETRDPAGRPLPGLLSVWLAAEAHRRSGDSGAARAQAERARAEAARIHHVWLEADLARYLDELE